MSNEGSQGSLSLPPPGSYVFFKSGPGLIWASCDQKISPATRPSHLSWSPGAWRASHHLPAALLDWVCSCTEWPTNGKAGDITHFTLGTSATQANKMPAGMLMSNAKEDPYVSRAECFPLHRSLVRMNRKLMSEYCGSTTQDVPMARAVHDHRPHRSKLRPYRTGGRTH